MSTPYQTPIGSFTRKSTFFWASVGATVGLANLWQFPYLASLHGGGLFILLYLGCLLLITLPLTVTEAAFGRHARHGIVLAMEGLIRSAGVSRAWMLAGRLSILAAFLVLSFTAVFGAIALAYVFYGALGRFTGADQTSVTGILSALVSDPAEYRVFMGWHALFVLLVVWVSLQGVAKGLERSLRIVVPGILILMLGLLVLTVRFGQIDGAVAHILDMRPQDITLDSLKAALFHAFFTLGLGMGVWAIFGAYASPRTQLKRSVLAVVLVDTLIAILAGVMIFSVAGEGGNLEGVRGVGLLFVSLPVALSQLPASQFLIAAAFLVVVLVVWTTSIGLLEPVVGWFREWIGAPRVISVLLVGLAVWFAGLASLLSLNIWAHDQYAGATVFRWLELFTGGLLIPVIAILLAVFAGWCLTRPLSQKILGRTPRLFEAIWFWVMRLVLPVVVAYIGIQYTTFSLGNLCESGGKAIWCSQPVMELSGPAGEAEVKKPAGGTAQPSLGPVPEVDDTLDVNKPQGNEGEVRETRPSAPESTPQDDDILYHSV
jgi:NSS family neurotransmitter:Na+ symporter